MPRNVLVTLLLWLVFKWFSESIEGDVEDYADSSHIFVIVSRDK
jgi:hypothetical protein